MTKNDIINEVVSSLVFSLNKDQLELVKSTFIVKMHGYEIHELCTLPSTEVRDNDFILFLLTCLLRGMTALLCPSQIFSTHFYSHASCEA